MFRQNSIYFGVTGLKVISIVYFVCTFENNQKLVFCVYGQKTKFEMYLFRYVASTASNKFENTF